MLKLGTFVSMKLIIRIDPVELKFNNVDRTWLLATVDSKFVVNNFVAAATCFVLSAATVGNVCPVIFEEGVIRIMKVTIKLYNVCMYRTVLTKYSGAPG